MSRVSYIDLKDFRPFRIICFRFISSIRLTAPTTAVDVEAIVGFGAFVMTSFLGASDSRGGPGGGGGGGAFIAGVVLSFA